ncbi:hypothetical protein LBMAG56_13660 [Verrucomicrobiota bacterium]|nr:hypothetical protein LBMAG56_13660 [Verrucomicrobiota bacterium]
MKTEMLLQIQSWVDGRLSAGESAEVERFVAANPDAQALAGELRMTKLAFAGNEPTVTMPESREFFWSKVQREIARQEAAGVTAESAGFFAPGWWRKLLVPVTSVAGLALVAVLVTVATRTEDGSDQIESQLEGVSTVTYGVPGMKVIWIDRNEPMSDEPTSIDNIETK